MLAKKFKFNKGSSHGSKQDGNILIKGENNKVLTELVPFYEGKVKCIYIDPPYNNGETYHHYNDNNSHESWLKQIKLTLTLLKPFLSKDGSIWISIDDNELHYLKVAADSIFGRNNFIATIAWQHRSTRENRSVFSRNHEYILVYAADPKEFKLSRNLTTLGESVLKRYKNPDNDPRGPWQSISINVQDGHAVANQFYEIVSPSGRIHHPPNGRCWIYSKERFEREVNDDKIWFGKQGTGVPRAKKFLNGSIKGLTPETLWLAELAGTTESAKKHLLEMFPSEKVFDTPKPEQLIKHILSIATNENDLVLDCYLGAGSTISTAHKMGRKYIGIEIGEHMVDLVVGRMRLVCNGESGGISNEFSWKGGGGFSFFDFS